MAANMSHGNDESPMCKITQDLIRRKAEHHDGLLNDLNEISLHQLHIEKIEVLDRICPRLQILYLQNNLISKIENLKRMKDLKYINLALNNLTRIEGLQRCEKLDKLDMTVNFVDMDTFERSIDNLKENKFLDELYLTGNPCTEFEGYRSYVIACLPTLRRLDGQDVTRSERIIAKQEYAEWKVIVRELGEAMQRKRGTEWQDEDSEDEFNDKGEKLEKYTPQSRYEMYREMAQDEKDKKKDSEEATRFAAKKDYMKEAMDKLNVKEVEQDDGTLPRQRNTCRYDFEIDEDQKGNIVAVLKLPKFMDTSLIDVDMHPRWFQCLMKGKSFLMHVDLPINPDKSKVQRILSNGHLVLTMPIVDYDQVVAQRGGPTLKEQRHARERAAAEVKGAAAKKDKNNSVDYKHITKKKKQEIFLREVEVRRSEGLERERLRELALEEDAQEKKDKALAQVAADDADDDDDDCPPLM